MQNTEPAIQTADRRETRGRVINLAFPTIVENLMATLVQFVDTAMVGGLGAAATAAVAVNSSPMWLLNGLVMSVGVGGTALVARMIGAGQRQEAEKACQQVLIGGLAMGVLLTLLAVFGAQWLPRLMRADPALHADAAAYFRIIGFAFIPHFTGMVLSAVLRGAGDTRTPMLIGVLANGLNVIGNFLLIFPSRLIQVASFSVPIWGAGWGVRGAAVSTAASTALAGLLVMLAMRRSSRLRLTLRGLRPDGALIGRIMRVGLPAAMERVSINLGQIVFTGMVASLGTVSLAAHHLALTVESLSYMPGYGFAAAATTLVGQSLGANAPEDAKRYGALSIRLSLLLMIVLGVALLVFARGFMRVFTPDPAVQAVGADLVRICAMEQPFMALAIVCSGALRGAGDTRAPFGISLISMWGVRLLAAWLLMFVLGMGVRGAWLAMVADLVVRGLLTWRRFERGRWMHMKV
ncbi:MAG: MATE family efflux transporter [Clostridia bacterium]